MQPITYYVATDGNDQFSGSLAAPDAARADGPFATLARARAAVRAWKSANPDPQPVQVMIRGGKYFLTQTLILGPEDSGTAEYPVTYQAYPGEKPILSGGKVVCGWEPYRGAVQKCDVPGAKGGKWKFRQLFYAQTAGELSQRQVRARYPKFDPENPLYGGWAFMQGPADDGANRAWDFPDGIGWHMSAATEGGVANAFRCKEEFFPRRWAKPTEGEVCMFPGFGWGYEIIPIGAVDETERVIKLRREMLQYDRSQWHVAHSFTQNLRFFIENMLEDLTGPGEWCLDSEDGVLYFWPPENAQAGGQVIAPALDCLIDLRGAAWVTISGLTFTETLDGDDILREDGAGYGPFYPRPGLNYCGEALRLKRAEHCRVESCHFYAVGGNAIYLQGTNYRNEIQGNHIELAGANGICLVGSQLQHPVYNLITNNEINNCGKVLKLVAGVFLGMSDGNIVAHNLIHHMSHHAINLASNGYGRNIIEYNELRFNSLETMDNGAINSWGDVPIEEPHRDAERSGHIIRYNLIADTVGCHLDTRTGTITAPDPTFTNGIYLDDYTSNCLVYGNIVLRAGIGVMIHGGKNNLCENNILVDCTYPIRYFDSVSERYANWQMQSFMAGNHFCHNIVYAPGSFESIIHLGWRFADKVIGRSDENLYWHGPGGIYMVEDPGHSRRLTLPEWQTRGFDRLSQVGDPLFLDPAGEDFRLQPQSPALQLGFQALDRGKMGLQKK